MYSMDLNGLIICYTAALPFYKGTILGFIVYSSFLFGVFETTKNINFSYN